jgi:hypothetical protein
MWLTLLSNWRVWAFLGLIVSNLISYSAGHKHGYDAGAEDVQIKFDLYKQDALETALAAQVAKDAAEKRMRESNEKVTADYENLQAATATAVRALDSDRMRLLEALRRKAPAGDPAPVDPGTGLPPDATAEDRVLAECLNRYESVAGDADEIAVKLKKLQDYVANVVPH